MSELFYGFATVGNLDQVATAVERRTADISFRFGAIAQLIVADAQICRGDSRRPALLLEMSAGWSSELGDAMAFAYDSMVGERTAWFFSQGVLVEEFGSDSELWVMYNEDGELDESRGVFRADQLDEDEEYDLFRSAIEIGLLRLHGINAANVESIFAQIKEFMISF
jgi:hypothetical protein